MASTNHKCVGKALGLVKDGLQPFVEREMKVQHVKVSGRNIRGRIPMLVTDTNVCHNQVTAPDSWDQDLSSQSSGRH